MRFAGDAIQGLQDDRPVVPAFNPDDLKHTPELPKPTPQQQYQRDNYILRPRSGVAILPGGEQGPAQGPNIPIKNYDGQYMPDGSQPTGYKHGPVAALPVAIPAGAALLKGASKAYGAYQTGKFLLDGGAVNPGTRADYNNQDPTNKYNRAKQNDYSGPASRSPYHQ